MLNFLSKLFVRAIEQKSSQTASKMNRRNGRPLRMEQLEERALLSVSPTDIAAIQEHFSDYEIPADVNYIEVTAQANSSAAQLRAAIAEAGRTKTDDIILLRGSYTKFDLTAPIRIAINAEQFGSVTIIGIDNSLYFSGGNQTRVLDVTAESHVRLANATIASGYISTAGERGAGLRAMNSTVELSNVRFSANRVSEGGYGGAIYQQGGTTILNDVRFSTSVGVFGGAFAVVNGVTEQTNVVYESSNHSVDLTGASVTHYGGAVFALNSTVSLTDARLTRNAATVGGGIYLDNSAATIINATIASNTGISSGAGINVKQSPNLTVRNSIILGNSTTDVNFNTGSINFENNIVGIYSSNYRIDSVSNRLGLYTATDVFRELDLFRLRDGSPAVNAGTNEFIQGVSTDIEGNPRIQKGTVDLGAIESAYDGPTVPIVPQADLVPFARNGLESPLVIANNPDSFADTGAFLSEEPVYVKWGLKNIGNAVGNKAFTAAIYVDGQEYWSNTFGAGIPVDYVLGNTQQITGLAIGEHLIELRLDTQNTLNEADETNNIISKTITVTGPQVDLVPFARGSSDSPLIVSRSSAFFDSNILYPNETFYVTWQIKNIGTTPTNKPVTVAVYVDGQESWSETLSSRISADSVVRKTGIALPGLSAGEHIIELRIDPENVLAESNETNNTFSKIILVEEQPLSDLVPFAPAGWSSPVVVSTDPNVYTDSDVIRPNEPFYIHCGVKNIGDAQTNDVLDVYVFIDGQRAFGAGYAGRLRVGEIWKADRMLIKGLSAGEHTIEVRVDYNGTVTELNETNNVYVRTITIKEPLSDLAPATPEGWASPLIVSSDFNTDFNTFADDAIFYTGKTYNISFAAGNIGEVDVSNANIELVVDGRVIQTAYNLGIPVNQQFTLENIPIQWDTAGEHTIELRIDPNNNVNESDETNNVFTKTIHVEKSLPDLTLDTESNDSIRFSQLQNGITVTEGFVSGSNLIINYGLKNIGNSAVNRSIPIEVRVDGNLYQSWYQGNVIEPGQTLSLTATIIGLSVGEHTIEIRIDSQNLLNESNETNNVFSKTVTILPKAPVIEALRVDSNTPAAIQLSWSSDVSSNISYTVERAKTGQTWSAVGNGVLQNGVWNFTDTNFEFDTPYQYRVVAHLAGIADTVSQSIAVKTLPKPVTVTTPEGLTLAVRSSSQIDIKWDTVADADKYRLQRSVYGSNTWTTVYEGKATNYSNTGLAAGTKYVYRVAALKGTVVSDYSPILSAQTQINGTAPAPTDLKVTANTKNSITVAWNSNSFNATGFTVEWSTDGVTWKSAAIWAGTKSFTITGLTADTAYTIRAAADSWFGRSAYSDLLTAQTATAPVKPLAPTNLQLASKTINSATISWTKPASDVTGYKIEWSLDGRTWSSITVPANSTNATIGGLWFGWTYSVRVTALNVDTASDLSSILTVRL